ncbi:MAG: MotA/TolQ/ExbB proton channel family protein [Planctomycetota bacterium]|jgi:biopolymer transport protein ExbB
MLDQILPTLLAQADPSGGADTSLQVNSVWDFVLKGGPVMWPIILCSLVALAVFLERLVSLRTSRVIPKSFLPGLQQALSARDAKPVALDYCRTNESPIARVFLAGIKRLGEPIETLERHISEAGEREATALRKHLRVLSVIAAIAPLLGLLGTIFGMIDAFQTVATTGEALGKTELLAEGIYEAMTTTAAGLIVAIPALIMYHWVSARVDAIVVRVDAMTVEFIEDHTTWQANGTSRAADTTSEPATNSTPTPEPEPATSSV